MGNDFSRARSAGRAGVTRPTVIGVTGNIASGKSAVLAIMAELGAETIDADQVYHELIAPDWPLNQALRSEFGPGIVKHDGAIDRAALGRVVFSDRAALARLDSLTHPAVMREVLTRIAASRARAVVVDAIKLIEGGMDRHCDRVWFVRVDRANQIERLISRNGISRDEAIRRIDAVGARPELEARADAVIDNSGSLETTRAQVEKLWRELAALPFSE
jgi:dephospho-CoA kinase